MGDRLTESPELNGPRWIINFPTKAHWRYPSKLDWIKSGLQDLRRVIQEKGIKSIALPPLGSGNGGLDWRAVRPLIESVLGDLPDVEVVVYEPTAAYQNVTKTTGVEKLTPARAMIAEMIRRYEVLGFDCSILEVQKLAWVLSQVIKNLRIEDPLKLNFVNGSLLGVFRTGGRYGATSSRWSRPQGCAPSSVSIHV